MSVKELQPQLIALSADEKVQVLEMLAHELGEHWLGIEKNTGVAGGEACIVRTRIPVWTLEGYRRLGWNDDRILANYPTLRSSDLLNAWAYVHDHSQEIQNALRVNESAYMARLYSNENFPIEVVTALRGYGHDVLTVSEAGNANASIPDDQVIAFAISSRRAVLTINRWDFVRLHKLNSQHMGIIVCTQDADTVGQAERIHTILEKEGDLTGKLIRINRPQV